MSAGARLPVMKLASAPAGNLVELCSGRGPKVVIVVHSTACSTCRDFLRRLGLGADSIAEWGGRVSIVVREPLQAAAELRQLIPPAFRVLIDHDERLDITAPALLIADEWGEIFFEATDLDDHSFPALAEIAEWLRFIAIQCPECEQPEGEWRSL